MQKKVNKMQKALIRSLKHIQKSTTIFIIKCISNCGKKCNKKLLIVIVIKELKNFAQQTKIYLTLLKKSLQNH